MIPDQRHEATSRRLVERARAKINLTLRILGRRADGYHELDSLVAFADECDVVTLEPDASAGLIITGPMGGGLTAGADNLVVRAIELVGRAAPGLAVGHVALDKHLPIAAGIGGGSADAAAMLRLLRRANPGLSIDWMSVAAHLGADVPVCFADRAAMMRGTGERVVPLASQIAIPALLVNPMVDVPTHKTAAVFRALGAGPHIAGPHVTDNRTDTAPTDVRGAVFAGCNDLEQPASRVMPVIADVLSVLRALPGAQLVRLSGAGPTCFAVFDTIDAAIRAQDDVSAMHAGWWVRATHLS